MIRLTKRLEAIKNRITPGGRVIDVGTDHGMLPVYLAENGLAVSLAATDINAEPLARGKELAAEHGVQDRISFVLTDGLRGVGPEFDTVVIAGMGGETMISILEAAPWVRENRVQLILQPQSKFGDLTLWLSAQQYIGICLWLLRIYTPQGGRQGDWCDFPHLIELINQDYTKVLSIVKRQPALDGKARVFVDALEANAQDQLQGQIASARIPLNDIASPALYWVLSGNDFNLDINDPEDPKILCIGNDPDRQQVYGAALSLFTFRVIKRVNRKGKLPCAVVIDELPTISVQGLDGLMATARSNKVAVVLGIQDLTQVKADYGDKVADKILALPANVFVGASSVTTAEKYSKEFGKEFRRQESQTRSVDSESVNISFHEEEVMPIRKITSLPQGTFIGKVAVENNSPVKQPFFCGAIQIDLEEFKRKEREAEDIPDLSDFELGGLRDQVRIPEIGRAYMLDSLKEAIREEWARAHREGGSEDDVVREAESRLAAMSDSECERALQDMIPDLEKKEIARIIEDNFYAIKDDIGALIKQECPEPEEEAYVEETLSEDNQ